MPVRGSRLDRSTLGDWVGQAAWLLDPVVAKIRQHVFAAEKIHGDDTTVPVLAPGLGRTATGRLWVYVRDDRLFCGPAAPAAAYFYSPDRGAEHPAAHMASFTGFLQADGYAGFEGLYNPARTKPGPITEVACLAHCRRKFYDVWETTKSPVAKEALDRIAAVYAIEDKARFAPAAERVEHRRETAPLLDKFFEWGKATVGRLSGKLELAKAFRYTIDRREALTRFVTDGRLEVDNNVAENAMRGIAMRPPLYPSFSTNWKHWKFSLRLGAIRVGLSQDRRLDPFRSQIGRLDLERRAGNDLFRGKNLALNQAPDNMRRDAQFLGGFPHRQPFASLGRGTVGMDVVDPVAAIWSSLQRLAMLRMTANASSAVRQPCSPVLGFLTRSCECWPPFQ